MKWLGNAVQVVACASAALVLAAALCVRHAAAASLVEVQSFGNNPSNARMFIYVPDKLAAMPPVLVAIHYCGGSANAYFTGTGYRALSDRYGFIVIYPQTTSSDGCFDVHSDATLTHDGGGDSAGIASMVRYTLMKYGADAGRVYVTGTSSGAMMTNVMLGAYPDLFRAGAVFAGVPFACFAGTSGWNSACAQGQITKTGQEWGDLVRAAYPGYAGPRPRVQLWHGDQDQTLNFHNFGEEIKQWTNVLGVSETPTTTEQNAPQSGWTRTRYDDAAGIVRVEAVLEAGQTHNLTVPAGEAVRFFGLDGMSDPGGATAGTGAAGAGGAGAAGSAGASSAGHAGGTAGAGGAAAGSDSPSSAGNAGVPGNAGASASAGIGGASAVAGSGPSTGLTAGAAAGAPGTVVMSGSPALGQAGAVPAGSAGSGAEPHRTSSGCSVHAAGLSGERIAGTWIALLAAALRRATRPVRRERARGKTTDRGTP